MNKLFLFFLLSFWSVGISAQMDISAFNATGSGYSTAKLTDYQCLGINPANLGWSWSENSMNLGLVETGFSIHTQALTRKQVSHDLPSSSFQMTMEEREQAAANFSGKRFWAQAAVTWLGFSFQDDKAGGFAFSIRERFLWNTKFNLQAARFLFLGYRDPYFDSKMLEGSDSVGYASNPLPASTVYAGTNLQFIWYREYNLGYGRKIMNTRDFDWYGGIGLKYLTGYGSFQYLQDGSGLKAFTALSPVFNVNYNEVTPSKIEGKGLKKTGNGFGADIGTTLMYKQNLKVALSVNDIGFIKWNGNVYEGQEVRVWRINSEGIDNYDLFSQGELIKTDAAPGDPDRWKGLKYKKVWLPTNLRAGATYKVVPKLEFGTDLYIPLKKDVPGAYEGVVFGLGTVYEPAKWVQLSIGFVTGKDVGTNVPVGITFFPARDEDSSWQLGFALRDVSTYFKNSDPTVSMAVGFLRFAFGNKRV
ncbi:MAG: DUF5723 family protein [Bacteroidetes bacterium]|nr:DUF5723 family protein [Bacteroidota bacterium]